jgi:hypothetical protein
VKKAATIVMSVSDRRVIKLTKRISSASTKTRKLYSIGVGAGRGVKQDICTYSIFLKKNPKYK